MLHTRHPEKRVLIVAGEASADAHGARLVAAMLRRNPSLSFSGIGGPLMAEAGVRLLFPASEVAVVGLTEVLRPLRTIVRAAARLKNILRFHPPDLLILIDYPEFNLHLARHARRRKVPVLYYICPQVWAWRRGRIRKLARRVDRMAVILPFEAAFYRRHSLDAEYVGHPLMDRSEDPPVPEQLPAPAGAPCVGLVPGSREEEIRNLLPVMLAAVARLKVRFPDIQCILPLATTIAPELVRSLIATAPFPVVIRSGPLPRLLAGCDVALVTSGTATLETAMAGVPMVVVYRVSEISYRVGRAVIRVPHIGLVNLVAQKEICPELIQGDANPERLAVEAEKILEKAEVRNRMTAELRRVADLLGGRGASGRTAEMALALMGEKREAKVGQQCSLVS